jgi:hypothetical protein
LKVFILVTSQFISTTRENTLQDVDMFCSIRLPLFLFLVGISGRKQPCSIRESSIFFIFIRDLRCYLYSSNYLQPGDRFFSLFVAPIGFALMPVDSSWAVASSSA